MTKGDLKFFLEKIEGLSDDIEIQFPDGRPIHIEYRCSSRDEYAVLVIVDVESAKIQEGI